MKRKSFGSAIITPKRPHIFIFWPKLPGIAIRNFDSSIDVKTLDSSLSSGSSLMKTNMIRVTKTVLFVVRDIKDIEAIFSTNMKPFYVKLY